MQTFTGQFYVNQKTLALESQIHSLESRNSGADCRPATLLNLNYFTCIL